jgi:hypothetical protein
MKYILLIVLICAAIIAFVLIRRRKASTPPVDVYVCSECGLKHCVCRKEPRDDSESH